MSSTETIEAIAIASGYADSAVASASYTLNVPASFTVTASTPSLTVKSGSQGVVTLTLAPQQGFHSAVTFTCAGLPAGARCNFNPATVTPSSDGAATTQLTIATNTQSGSLGSGPGSLFPGVSLAATVCFLWIKRRRGVWSMVLLAVACAGMGTLMSCGGNSSGSLPSPAPVTSNVTVTALSGSIQESTTISLTVN